MGAAASIPEYQIDVTTGEGSRNFHKYEQYNIFKDFILGGGTFGDVFKGYDTDKRRLIAAKEIRHASAECSKTEVEVLKHLSDHDNIVKLYDTFIHEGNRFIIMQLCDGLRLDKFMIKKNPAIDVRLEIISQMIETMQYLHFNTPPTAHRDVKPANIMIVHGSHVKLCDFGLAKFMDLDKSLYATMDGGTAVYMSPEMHTKTRYNPFKADVFAAGLVFLAIITYVVGEKIDHVFQAVGGIGAAMNYIQDVLQKKLDGLDYACEQTMALISLIARMVKFKPEERPDFNEIFTIFIKTVVQGKAAEGYHSDTEGSGDAPTDPGQSVPQGGARPKKPQRTAEKPGIQAESRGNPGPRDDQKAGPSGDQKPGPSGDQKAGHSGNQRPTTNVPMTRGEPVSLELITSHDVTANWIPGLGERGHVVLAEGEDITVYRLHGQRYGRCLKMPLPEGVGANWWKAADANGRVLLQNSLSSDIVHYDSTGKETERRQHEGILLSVVREGEVAYRQDIGNGKWRILVQRGRDSVCLQPPAPRTWGTLLSVCCLQDQYCVTDTATQSLDIFSRTGEHIVHEKLTYEPAFYYAITAVSTGYLLIAEWDLPVVHIHAAASGREVGTWTHRDLQVAEEEYVQGMRYNHEDGVLHLCTGGLGNISSLHACRVIFKDKDAE